jgi:hypothetical protein
MSRETNTDSIGGANLHLHEIRSFLSVSASMGNRKGENALSMTF